MTLREGTGIDWRGLYVRVNARDVQADFYLGAGVDAAVGRRKQLRCAHEALQLLDGEELVVHHHDRAAMKGHDEAWFTDDVGRLHDLDSNMRSFA